MTKVAAIIVNRNLPAETDAVVDSLLRHDADLVDAFVVESGSDDDRLSRHCTWHATDPEARAHGLRFCRGINFGLTKLLAEGRFLDYDAFLLMTNDCELGDHPVVAPLLDVLERHPRVGLLSPCSRRWGERALLESMPTRYLWYAHNAAMLVRRQFVESIMEIEAPDHMNFLYDGSNFRGYGSDLEITAKGYANDWATAITSRVMVEENERHLLDKASLIKTESYEENFRLYLEEGKLWMRRKYGFNSRWMMQVYAKMLYDDFFKNYPEYAEFRI
ncbi:MAG: hypothetical protein HQL39_01735 [Alphaproteobacteria bacterium]|nr:hypothetical protein [Alphaproteobacteria bacterium]